MEGKPEQESKHVHKREQTRTAQEGIMRCTPGQGRYKALPSLLQEIYTKTKTHARTHSRTHTHASARARAHTHTHTHTHTHRVKRGEREAATRKLQANTWPQPYGTHRNRPRTASRRTATRMCPSCASHTATALWLCRSAARAWSQAWRAPDRPSQEERDRFLLPFFPARETPVEPEEAKANL
jgi:hypothetical protein